MKLNMSNLDRAIRILLSIVVIALIKQQVVTGLLAAILVGLTIIVVTTSIFGVCPLYTYLGMSTTKKNKRVLRK